MNPGLEESTLTEFEGDASPIAKQIAIARFLDRADWRIARSAGAEGRLIDLLRRARPIADVVTGKLDVREIAAARSKFVPRVFEGEVDGSPDADDAPRLDDERKQFEVLGAAHQ